MRRYLAFPNILDPHGQRSNALEYAGPELSWANLVRTGVPVDAVEAVVEVVRQGAAAVMVWAPEQISMVRQRWAVRTNS